MAGESDKKINYKILTADHLLEEKASASKEIKEKKIDLVKSEIIEPQQNVPDLDQLKSEVEPKDNDIFSENKINIVTSGLKSDTEVKNDIPLPQERTSSLPKDNFVPQDFSSITVSQDQEKKEDIFYRRKEKPIIFSSKVISSTQTSKEIEHVSYLYPLIAGFLFLLLVGIYFFKPNVFRVPFFQTSKTADKNDDIVEKFLQTPLVNVVTTTPTSKIDNYQSVTSSEMASVATSSLTSTAETEITFQTISTSESINTTVLPIISVATTLSTGSQVALMTTATVSATPTPETLLIETTTSLASKDEELLPESISERLPQGDLIFPDKELPFISSLNAKKIELLTLSFNEFVKEMNSFLIKQEAAGSLIYLDFWASGRRMPLNFVFDYFVKDQKISQDKLSLLKSYFTGNYVFMIYYRYTRKYPIIVYEIKNSSKVMSFHQQWEKENMANNLKGLFLNDDPGLALEKKFVDKNYQNIYYRALNFKNNYQLIWAVIGNYLIYTSSESAFKNVINLIKNYGL